MTHPDPHDYFGEHAPEEDGGLWGPSNVADAHAERMIGSAETDEDRLRRAVLAELPEGHPLREGRPFTPADLGLDAETMQALAFFGIKADQPVVDDERGRSDQSAADGGSQR